MTPPPDKQPAAETLERTCMMCDEVRRVIAKVGSIDIKEPCPCKCGPGYFEPPGRVITRAIREGK